MIKLTFLLAVFALTACAQETAPERQIAWRLEDDIAAYRGAYDGQPEMMYRVDELAVALTSAEYETFVDALAATAPVSEALIYYESAPNASRYVFAFIGANRRGCVIVISDANGVRRGACRGVPEFHAEIAADELAIRDPGIAGLVQFASAVSPVRRAMSILPANEPSGLETDSMLLPKIERIFGPEL